MGGRPNAIGFGRPGAVRLRNLSMNRTPSSHPSPPVGGEGARRAVEGDSDWFRVPMHGKNGVGAFHERSVLSPGFSRSGPPEGGTPNKWRHTPMQSIKVGRLSMLTPKRSPEGHL